MANAARKLNRRGESHSGRISRPLDLSVFGNMSLTAAERKLGSALRGFSRNGHVGDFTQEELAARYHTSCSTVARMRKKLLTGKAFKRGEKVYEYIFTGAEPQSKGYFIIHEWLYHAEFELEEGKARIRLTDSAVEVLSYIKGFYGKGIDCTRNWLAKQLHVSPDTVSRSVRLLEALNLITVTYPKGKDRAVNDTVRTHFCANKQVLDAKCIEVVKHVKSKAQAVKDANERSERDSYYSKRQNSEKDRQEKLLEYLRQDSEFAEAETKLRLLELEAAKAEHAKNYSLVEKLLEHRKQMKEQYRASLARAGYTEQDLEPKYECAECKDTGVRQDRTFCDCWRRRLR